ncbi:hypothetical protein PG994_011428 [Apiospora phragmitis]|uniref:Uncharacterized protein n=1 Tax=Apiospora phragmitis TaxID=2905665 RepID=A0ABR1TVC0_9PEZI
MQVSSSKRLCQRMRRQLTSPPTQQVAKIALSLLAIAGADAAVIERTPLAVATVTPYLAPLCKTVDVVFSNLCTFNPVTLTQSGRCQNVPNTCNVHYPASFTASTNQDNGGSCQVVVYSESGCTGSPISSGALSTQQSGCIESTYPGKAVTDGVGLVNGGNILPFGFKSAQLVCGGQY